MTTQRTITLPADQWEVILEAVECHCDEGPPGEGWKSPKLSAACAALRVLLEKPESEPDHPDYFLAWILFACDGKLRPEAQRVLAAHGIAQTEPAEATDEELRRRFLIWWREEGSAMRPHPEHDHEEHARLVSEIAWANGAYVARWGGSAQHS